jgi:hypothetical protein
LTITTHKRLDAAVAQLHTAIALYLSGSDYLSAATLAGAADGQLGEALQLVGKDHALRSMVPLLTKLTERLTGEALTDRDAWNDQNAVRDWLKHSKGQSETLRFDAKEAAFALIDRGIINFVRLTGRDFTPPMRQFLATEGLA